MAAWQPTVSVIMPAYNVGTYVRRAVRSLQAQTLRDFELIVVDDGSKDQTGAILDRLAEDDYRITVLHVENGGAAAARNLAMDRAHGTYYYFMDADDWAVPTMLADMVALAREHELEMVVAGFYIDTYYGSRDEHTSEIKSRPDAIYETAEDFRTAAWELFDQNLLYPPWNKLFLRERIERLGIRYRPTFMDDFPFVLDNVRDIERVGVLSQPYYHFIRQRSESETSRWRPDLYEKREEEHDWMLDLYRHWGLDQDPDCNEMIQRRYIERLVGCIENVCDPACTLPKKEKLALIEQMISNDRAQEAVAVARPHSRMMKLMLMPIARKNPWLAYREGRVISLVKRHNTKLFATLKANR